MNRYLRTLVLVFGLLMLLASSWIYVADPYALHQSPADHLFARKTAAADKGRTLKSYQSVQRLPQTLIIGNSRVEIGMPTTYGFYQGSVFNLGLPGAGVQMQYDYGWHTVMTTHSVKKVLLAVDFTDFLSNKPWDGQWYTGWLFRLNYHIAAEQDFVPSGFKRFKELISFWFSQDAFVDATLTALQQQMLVNALDYQGFNDSGLYLKLVTAESYAPLYLQKQQELTQRLVGRQLKVDPASLQLQALKRFIALLQQQQVEVVLFINPYQLPFLEVIDKAGLTAALQEWKQLVQTVAQQSGVDLYDFAIRSTPVTAAIDLSSTQVESNPFFWEPSHYKRTFGVLMLDAIQQQNCVQPVHSKLETICQAYINQPSG